MHTHTQTRTNVKPTAQFITFNDELMMRFASSLVRLIVLNKYCDSEHPCTIEETRIFRKYDDEIARHAEILSSHCARQPLSHAFIKQLIGMFPHAAQFLSDNPDFQLEVKKLFTDAVKITSLQLFRK